MSAEKIIAVVGGIGSGKSVVCRVLRSMGYPVYDCDSRARFLQDSDAEMRRRIATEVTADALNPDGTLNRPALAACVFSCPDKLRALNRIVHGAVADDLREHIAGDLSGKNLFFVETAILYESGLDRMVNAVWEVTAPEDVRVARVMSRSGLSADEVRARIAAQSPSAANPKHYIIINDGETPLLPQIFDGITQRI